jgi:hypothetical protein
MKELGYIYKIENTVNGKVYVGQSKQPDRRWNDHKRIMNTTNERERRKPLYVDMREYGVDRFSFSLLEKCEDNDMNEREAFWIDRLHSQFWNNGYNIYGGGRGQGTFVTRPISQYDLDGNFIRAYQNQCEAARATGLDSRSIGKACNGKLITCGGFQWRYSDDGPPESYREIRGKAVLQYDLDGNLVKRYENLKQAGDELGIRYQDISDCCKGIYYSVYGHVWKFEKQVGDVS